MNIQKPRSIALIAAFALFLAGASGAQAPDTGKQADLEELFAELAQEEREDWSRIEGEIRRIWSQSGSQAMDLLLRRGNDALEAGDYKAAIEHFSALTEQAPDFAEGWNARATAYYLQGHFSLSISDIEQVLVLNPRHFGALSGLATILEQTGDNDLALTALRAVEELNPNNPQTKRRIERLEREKGAADL